MLTRRSSTPGQRPWILPLLLLLTGGHWLFVAGCGYQPLGAGPGSGGMQPDVQRVHLAALSNETFRPGLQGLVGAAILRVLQQDGRLHVTSQEAADAILAGSITVYQNLPVAFDQNDIGRRFRVRLTLAMRLMERGGEKILLKDEISGEAFYTTGSDVRATRAAEEEAAVRAARDLAAQVVARIADGL